MTQTTSVRAKHITLLCFCYKMKVMKNAHISCEGREGGGAIFVLISFVVDVTFQMFKCEMWQMWGFKKKDQRMHSIGKACTAHPCLKAEKGSKNDHFLGQVRI